MFLALTGPSIDGSLYTWFQHRAQSAPAWFDHLISWNASYGLGLFALLMIWNWWRARLSRSAADMAMALCVPVAVVVAFAVNDIVKSMVTEVRPCQAIPGEVTLQPCPGVGDWSFPSNHSAIAAASAVALVMVCRRVGATAIGVIASVLALVMAFSRVWVGAHYPHDVVAGLVVGAVAAVPVQVLARRYGAPVVGRLESGFLRPFLTADARGAEV